MFEYFNSRYAPYVLGIFFLAFSLDSLFYGRSIFCLWNFLRFNVLGGGNALFGVHPWHWYITQGLPPTLGIACIPLLTSMVNFRSFRIPKRYYLFFSIWYKLFIFQIRWGRMHLYDCTQCHIP